ncbi:hypothetical protein Tco_0687480 [Tanacetum coccineum]
MARRRHGKCAELRVVLILKAKSHFVPGILGRGSLSCVRRTSGVRSTANDVAYQVAYSPADWKKDQIALDEELAREIEAEEQAEFERIQKESVAQEEASRAAIYEEWDNEQAMMEADYELATNL